MQGSLENPPLIVRQSRWTPVVLPLGVALGIGILSLEPGHHGFARWPMTYAACIIAAGLYGLWKWLRPSWLEIWPDRIIWFSGFSTRAFAFSDIAKFEVFMAWRGRSRYPRVSFLWTQSARGGDDPQGIANLFVGTDSRQLLSSSWELSCQTLVDLLNQAHTRYAIAHAKAPSALAEG